MHKRFSYIMKSSIINCSRRKDGFSATMSSMAADHLDSDTVVCSVYDTSYSDIQDFIDSSDVVFISCPVFSSTLIPPFWDLLENISSKSQVPCILVVACGNSFLFCRSAVRSAIKKLNEIGFSPVESILVDGTYKLVPGEFLPRHFSRMDKACNTIKHLLS